MSREPSRVVVRDTRAQDAQLILPLSVTEFASAGDAALEQEMGVPSGWLAGV